MHADISMDSEEVWHRRSSKNGARRAWILFVFHILDYDLSRLVDIIAVEA